MQTNVRFFNGCSALKQCRIVFSGEQITPSLPFAQCTEYKSVPVGSPELIIAATTRRGRINIRKKVSVPPSEQLTFAILGKMNTLEIIPLPEPLMPPRPDRAYIRFVNLASRSHSPQIFRVSGDKVPCPAHFGNAGSYILAQEGGYVFRISVENAFVTVNNRFEAGHYYTLFILDNPLAVVCCVDR